MVEKILKNKQAIIGLIMIFVVACIAIFAPLITVNNPSAINPVDKFTQSSAKYPLGTDQLGRCIFSRLVYGARYSLGISVPILLILAVISIFVGTISAYIGGRFDSFFSIIFDIFMAFPPLLVVLSLVGALGHGIPNIIIAVVFSMWVWFAKIVRSYVLIEKKKEYIVAAKIVGCSDSKIIIRHIIPNVLPALLVYFSTGIAGAILMVSGFSFLGLGIEAGVPEWGTMLSGAKAYLYSRPLLLVYPGLCILFTAAGFNLFGEALRDIISPEEV
ncbi:MAG: ABC transporter permease subunit [Desulfobacterales bacterium]|nr:ABC transporter permease subunit [Desulfobacterales bacterium]